MMLMGAVDTMMVGRLSESALAAVAVGNLMFFGSIAFGMGVIMALDSVISQAVGAKDGTSMARGFQRGLLLAVLLTLPASLILSMSGPLLRLADQPLEVIPTASRYAMISIPGVFPLFLFLVFRQTLQALGKLRTIVVVIVLANLLNAGLNWALIFGHVGIPPLGAVGSAWASVFSRFFMALGLLAAAWRHLRPLALPWQPETLELAPFLRLLRLGGPVGVQVFLECGAFALVALLMGWLGAREIAAHQVAINLASLTFMVPLGVSGAASVLVGRAIGRSEMSAARRAAVLSLICGASIMTMTSVIFCMFPHGLARLYSNQSEVVALAAVLIPIAGVFQVFDGLQVVASGVLRGAGDTRWPMVINVLGFWLLGVPTALYLGFFAQSGPRGLWWGLVAGLGSVAILLLARTYRLMRRPIQRIEFDQAEGSSFDLQPVDLKQRQPVSAGRPDSLPTR